MSFSLVLGTPLPLVISHLFSSRVNCRVLRDGPDWGGRKVEVEGVTGDERRVRCGPKKVKENKQSNKGDVKK